MYQHHIDSIERLKEYYRDWEGVIAIVLDNAVASCPHRPANILQLGAKFLQDVNPETCAAFVSAFTAQTRLHMEQNLNRLLSDYTLYYEDWWREENPPFPNEW